MKICDFDGSRVIGPPKEWNAELDGPCLSIYVLDHRDTLTGLPMMYTFYKFTPEELEAINKDGALRLGIVGTSQHPVFTLAVLPSSIAGSDTLRPAGDLGSLIDSG